jgi:glycosyltransferase involved in cell wall biosynthesis
MKIIFLCGSLEPGRDGVGDYVSRLSAELLSKGNSIAAAAINDSHIRIPITQTQPQNGLVTLRLPATLKDDQRFKLLKSFIDDFDPDWISLQFVPFSFNPKGLVFGLAKKLAYAGHGRPWHIMFHELWVGMTEQSSKKELLWGMLQRELIKGLIRTLKPALIHTHTDLYKKQLEKMNVKAELLPLFSNIPVRSYTEIEKKISKGIQIADQVNIVVFGGIHKGAPIRELAEEANRYAERNQLQLNLVVVGRNGNELENWIKEWDGSNLSLKNIGEQPAEKISEILAQASLGIFTTPIALAEKSGSVAAMREHRMHLLCVSQPWTPKNISMGDNPFGILNYKKGNLEDFFKRNPDFSYMPVIASISEQFISDLNTDK